MCGENIYGKQQYTRKFISNVYAVLLQCRGRMVEDFAIKFDFDSVLVDHLNNWVRFSVASRTKFLALDLVPTYLGGRNDRYIFPFELLDKGSISRLQKIQVSFVSLQPSTQFNGFPNLRKLDLNLVHINGKDLQEILSNCCKLEWLRIVRCHPYDELKANSPLPCLVYLNVAYCTVTNIAFHAEKLATFEYKGIPVPIDLSKSLKLEIADIHFSGDTLEHAIGALASGLINVQNLTFNTSCRPPEVSSLIMVWDIVYCVLHFFNLDDFGYIYFRCPNLMDNPCKFSLLKHLKLLFDGSRDPGPQRVHFLLALRMA